MVVAGDDVVDILRIEVLQLGLGHAHHRLDLVEMEVAADHEGVGLHRHARLLRRDAVFAIIGHRVHRAHESGHIAARLTREVFVDAPEVAAAVRAADGLGDVAGAAVVGADGQGPVAEGAVGVAQIARGGLDGLLDVQALIHEGIDLQAVAHARLVHELPDAARAGAGCRHGVQHRLDDGHVLELLREAVAEQDVLEDREIIAAQAEHAAHLGGHALGIEDDVVLDDIVVGQRDEGIHRRQAAHHLGVGDVGREAHGVHVVFVDGVEVGRQRILVPELQQAVLLLGRVFETPLLLLPLEHGDLPLVQVDTPAEAVHQQLQRIQFAAKHFVLLPDLPGARALEEVVEHLAERLLLLGLPALLQDDGFGLALRLGGKRQAKDGQQDDQDMGFSHFQKVMPIRNPKAAGWETGLMDANWFSGRMKAGATLRAMSSSTSKLCIYEKTLASMICRR